MDGNPRAVNYELPEWSDPDPRVLHEDSLGTLSSISSVPESTSSLSSLQLSKPIRVPRSYGPSRPSPAPRLTRSSTPVATSFLPLTFSTLSTKNIHTFFPGVSPIRGPHHAPPQVPYRLPPSVRARMRFRKMPPVPPPSPPAAIRALSTPSPTASVHSACSSSPYRAPLSCPARPRDASCRNMDTTAARVLRQADSSSDESTLPMPLRCHEPPPSPPDPQLSCVECNIACRTKAALLRHQLRHSLRKLPDLRPFRCQRCLDVFPTPQSLHRHIRTHIRAQRETPCKRRGLVCPYRRCGEMYPDPARLTRHLEVHERLRHTDSRSVQMDAWKEANPEEQHSNRSNHSDQAQHLCSICDERFEDCKSLFRHQRALGERRKKSDCRECCRRRARMLKYIDNKYRIRPWRRLGQQLLRGNRN